MIEELQVPSPDSQPLHFDERYSRTAAEQFMIILHKNFTIYWRSPDYNAVRIFFTCIFGLLIGSIYWRKGNKRSASSPQTHLSMYHILVILDAATHTRHISP